MRPYFYKNIVLTLEMIGLSVALGLHAQEVMILSLYMIYIPAIAWVGSFFIVEYIDPRDHGLSFKEFWKVTLIRYMTMSNFVLLVFIFVCLFSDLTLGDKFPLIVGILVLAFGFAVRGSVYTRKIVNRQYTAIFLVFVLSVAISAYRDFSETVDLKKAHGEQVQRILERNQSAR